MAKCASCAFSFSQALGGALMFHNSLTFFFFFFKKAFLLPTSGFFRPFTCVNVNRWPCLLHGSENYGGGGNHSSLG